MGNVLDNLCGDKSKHRFCVQLFSKKKCTVYQIMSKNLVETEGPQMTSQHGVYALHAGLQRLHARMRMYLSKRHGTQLRRARTHACTHRPISNTYCSFTDRMISEHASLLCCTYIVVRILLYVYCPSCYKSP